MNLFANIIFGHIVGDFFLQPKWMALKKGGDTLICLIHTCIVTLAIGAFTTFDSGAWLAFVFATHFLIDRFSLAEYWLVLINGRSLRAFWKWGHKIETIETPKDAEEEYLFNERAMNYRILAGSFAALVYFVVDNAAHLMLYWYGYPYFF